MFTSAIDFVNDIEDIARKALNNVKENNVDSLELIQAIVNIRNQLFKYKYGTFWGRGA